MTFNWAYFPLENDGKSLGIQNQLPDFSMQNGNPWTLNNGWFNGDGSSTSLITPWSASPVLFEGVALPKSSSYMVGFQIELGIAPASNQTVFFCGYNKAGVTDGLKCVYTKLGELIFILKNRNSPTILKAAGKGGDISNQLINVFCHIDHRPAGVGINSEFIHTYEDATDIKYTSFKGTNLSNIGEIYPQEITQATALVIGADQNNGAPLAGSHFSGKIRRLHIMHFGFLAEDEPGNLAEMMNELSKANMIPTPYIKQLMGFPISVTSRSFVRYT